MTLWHHERGFNELLGEAAEWMEDGQWDEEWRSTMPQSMMSLVSPVSPASLLSRQQGVAGSGTAPCLTLHCRPNGQPNRCYEALVNSGRNNNNVNPAMNMGLPQTSPIHNLNYTIGGLNNIGVQGAANPVSNFTTGDPAMLAQKHLRGNGSILVLKHPSGTVNPQRDGAPVIDATLADLKLVVPYLRQRLQQNLLRKASFLQNPASYQQYGLGSTSGPLRTGPPGFEAQPSSFPGMGFQPQPQPYRVPQPSNNHTV